MKAYQELTRLGKLRRYQRVARAALDAFGFAEANLMPQREAGNILYRVKTKDSAFMESSLYANNRYLLRLHWFDYQNSRAVDSELKWLCSLSKAGIPAPQPVATAEGRLSVEISVPGVPDARRCSLLRWVKGRTITKHVLPWHLKAIGKLIARLHNHASSWKLPHGFMRRHYDYNGLWGDDTGTGYSAAEVWPRIPKQYFEAFKEVTSRVEQIMEDWGKGSDVYGLIHADLGTKANVLFHDQEAKPIDFDD